MVGGSDGSQQPPGSGRVPPSSRSGEVEGGEHRSVMGSGKAAAAVRQAETLVLLRGGRRRISAPRLPKPTKGLPDALASLIEAGGGAR